jgi:glycosyltransferase involved in cell wall biosynthesis
VGYDVTVLIPTFNRAHLLKYVFEALEKQTYKDFDVLVVLKPSGDGTERVVTSFQERGVLSISVVLQKIGYVTDALNLGMRLVKSRITAFLDDDAIPAADWLERLVNTYSANISGVSGNVLPVIFENGRPTLRWRKRALLGASEILPNYVPFQYQLARQFWSRPIKGQEDYLIYFSKAGDAKINHEVANEARQGKIVRSLLGMGANLSFLTETAKGFIFSDSWVLGIPCDNYLGWYLWKKGYNTVFNPQAKVYHIVLGETLSRGGLHGKNRKRKILGQVEGQLLFFRLHGQERELSVMHRLLWLIFSFLENVKNDPGEVPLNLRCMLLSNAIGTKWLLSRRINGSYLPLGDLEKLT